MKPHAKNVYRPAVGIVGGIADELIVEADFNRGAKSVAVIGLDDLLQPVMRQFAVAYDDAQAAGVEIGRVGAGNAVDDAGDAKRVIRPVPPLAVQRDPCLDRAVAVGVVPRLDIAVGPTRATEHAHGVGHLLRYVEAHSWPALIGAYRRQRVVGIESRRSGEREGVLKISHASTEVVDRLSKVERAGDARHGRPI